MSNDFSTIKNNKTVEKISLVRIQTAREFGASLSLVSGTTYSYTFHEISLHKLEVDGTEYTLVSSSPASGEYTFSEDTKQITVNLGAAYSSQQVVGFYYLFYSKDETRIAPQKPTDTSTTDRVWNPRIVSSPNTKIDNTDIMNGLVKYSSTAIRLHNQDHDFEQYLTDNDSFSNKEIAIWTALDNVENVQISFKGTIKRLIISDEVVIEFDDNLSLLNQTFYSNGSYLSSTFNTSKFANLWPENENAPIRKLYAEVTAYSVIEEDAGNLLYKVAPDRMLKAVCTNYNDDITTSNNRVWGTVLGEGDDGDQTDTVQAVDHSAGSYSLITYGSGKKYRIGDTLLIAGSKRVQVKYVDTGSDQFRCTKDATISATDAISRKGVSCVVITQGTTNYYPLYDRDYSLSVGTNDVILITFSNNFEATLGMNALDPNFDIVYFRAWADTSLSVEHGDVIQDVLETLGFDVNAASITAANATSLDTNFYVPYIEEESFPTFGNVIEAILRSTLGYITINNDLEIEYALLDAPSSSTVRNADDVLFNSLEITIDYNEICNSITPINKHDIIEIGYTNLGLESNKATYLHEVKKNREYTHVLSSADRLQNVINLISERKAEYSYKIKTKDLDAVVGDDFELAQIDLLGSDTTKDVTILGLEKQPNETIIIASDLLGL